MIFIRHSQTQQIPEISAHTWPLTAEGEKRCVQLAHKLQPYGLSQIVTSEEQKAKETGRIIAEQLNIPWTTAAGLEEQHRENAPYLHNPADFQATISHLLRQPNELVFGSETGAEAAARFATAVNHLSQLYPAGQLALVTHATILSLYLASLTTIDPYPFWQSLTMPCFVPFDPAAPHLPLQVIHSS